MCTSKIVVLLIKPIAFVVFPLPSPSSDLKVPINRRNRHINYAIDVSVSKEIFRVGSPVAHSLKHESANKCFTCTPQSSHLFNILITDAELLLRVN